MVEVNHFYVERASVSAQGTVSETWVDVGTTGRILASSLSANTKYLIVARAIFGGNDASDKVGLRVQTTDDTDVESKSGSWMENQITDGVGLKSWLFVHSFTTDATPDDIDIQYRVEDTAATAYLRNYSLFVMDLDDLGSDNYLEDINAATGIEISDDDQAPTILAEIADTALGTTEEWLILGYAKIGIGSTGVNFNVQLLACDDSSVQTTVNTIDEEGEDTTEERMCGLVARHQATSSPDPVTIEAYEDAGNGNMSDEGSYLIAIKTSAFADFEHDYTGASMAVGETEVTLASVGPYTPSTGGNHLIIGRTNKNVPDNDQVFMYLEDGSTPTRIGDSTPSHFQNWDIAKDKEAAFTMERISFSAEKTYNLRAISDSNTTAQHRWLLILNLNLASVGPEDQYITPALKQDLITAYDPTNLARGAVNVEPALYQSLATAYDPTGLTRYLDPAIYQQPATAYDPTNLVRGPVYIDPALHQQLAQAYDPTNLARGVVYIEPAIHQQLAQAYDPTDLVEGPVYIDLALFQQLLTAYDPDLLWYGFSIPNFRFRDGTDTATLNEDDYWGAGLSVDLSNINVTSNYPIRLRTTIKHVGTKTPGVSPFWYLQYRVNSGTWYLARETDEPVYWFATAKYTDGDPTTQVISSGLFSAGEGVSDNYYLQEPLAPGYQMECEYVPLLQAAYLSDGDVVDFRIRTFIEGVAIYTDGEIPSISVIKSVEQFITLLLQQELLTAHDPTINQAFTVTLFQQIATPYDPQVNMNIHPALHQQLMASYDPTTLQVSIHPALVQQLATAYDPVVTANYYITMALYQQLASVYDPGVIQDQFVEPAFIQQFLTAYDLFVGLGIAPTLVQSLLTAYDPTLTYTYDIGPDLVQSLAAAFDPTLSPGAVVVAPTLVDSSAAAYDPTVIPTYSVVVDLVNQTAVVYDPVLDQISPDQYIDPTLEQQLIAVFDPVVQGDTAYIILTTVSNLAQVFGVTIEGGEDEGNMLTMQDRSQ